ncbi:MAG: FAD-dependent oxidoreductase [Nitriliruptorales bacterium]|nr:FAD-dependent oxidoreductase [Nitriliruptorales bacterium]
MSRRALLRATGYAGLALATSGARMVRRRPRVVVLGGGVAGLTAAHELAIRGFDVVVVEARAWGGKARSTELAGSATGGRAPLPGEHGFRIEFGFYENLPDTLRRIPFGSSPNGTFDNLVTAPQAVWARKGGRRNVTLPVSPRQPAHTPQQVIDTIIGLLVETDLPPDVAARFASRMAVYMSSCDERRLGQWERVPWSEFIRDSEEAGDVHRFFGLTFAQFLQAAKSDDASAHFSARMFELFAYTVLGRGTDASLLRVFDAPTNEAWIDPWIRELERLGVDLRLGHTVERLHLSDGMVRAATVTTKRGTTHLTADWFVSALPIERAAGLWDRHVLRADPSLARIAALQTAWLNGLQIYLNELTPLAKGHVLCVDSPWVVSVIAQGQFWRKDFASSWGDGTARDCLSAVISNWNSPGVVFGKPARECSDEEILTEVWTQLKAHVNSERGAVLTDHLLHSFQIDPGLRRRRGMLHNEDPLTIPSVDSRRHRPEVTTEIPNLLLTGDFLKGDHLVGNMEAANVNSRRAVNALLEQAGSRESPAPIVDWYVPPEWAPAKEVDLIRWRQGKPHVLDSPLFDTDAQPDLVPNLDALTPSD